MLVFIVFFIESFVSSYQSHALAYAVGLILFALFAVCSFFIPKLEYIIKGKEDERKISASGVSSSMPTAMAARKTIARINLDAKKPKRIETQNTFGSFVSDLPTERSQGVFLEVTEKSVGVDSEKSSKTNTPRPNPNSPSIKTETSVSAPKFHEQKSQILEAGTGGTEVTDAEEMSLDS